MLMLERWGRAMARRRWWVIGAALAFLTVGGVWGSLAFGTLITEGLDDPHGDGSRALVRAVLLVVVFGGVAALSLPPTIGGLAVLGAFSALRSAEQEGSSRVGGVYAQAADASYARGRWDEAVAYADRLDQELLANPSISYLHAVAARIAIHRDDRETAEARLRAGGFLNPADQGRWAGASGPVADALALLAESRGDLAESLALRAAYLDLPPGPDRAGRCDEAVYLVRAALAQGEPALAEAAATAVAADPDPSPHRSLVIRFCRALVAADAMELHSVAADFGHSACLHHRALALEEVARVLAEQGDLAGARTACTDALAAWLDLGATWDARRLEARLRSYGVRRGPRTVCRRPAVGWDALTPSERHVAQLLARGMSNPDIAAELFVTRNTVQTHVSRVLTKLQMRSRIELVQQAAAIGETEGR
ncbi:helix-turn-helix domain-containing protein [Catellatospora coxensis]|uniref:HTH luxR-type domain-containing protein n=1 Tax=Catellatospora coxensis TaxID=310354 RepID=A0A8J3KZC4_9ACTN|nr:helix-turn-helix transcriptional regulator [Catellatospora coxensis]GIG11528.1 hypothetical protein Cco03nite_82280 [Catellatospora coxensis]